MRWRRSIADVQYKRLDRERTKASKKMAVKSPQQVESEMVYFLGQAHKGGYVKVRPTHSAINISSFANGGQICAMEVVRVSLKPTCPLYRSILGPRWRLQKAR